MSARVKKILLASAVVLMVVVMSVAGTLAYLATTQVVENEFKFGQIQVLVKDETVAGTDDLLAPGAMRQRKPYVQVAPKSDTFHEIVPSVLRVTITLKNNIGNQQDLMPYLELVGVSSKWDFTKEGDGTAANPYRFVGYYNQALTDYYDGTVTPGNTTQVMFEGVQLLPVVTDAVSGKKVPLYEGANTDFELNILVEAVQAEIEGTDYSNDAKGAFLIVDA